MANYGIGEYVRLANGAGIHGVLSVKVPDGTRGVVRETQGGTFSSPSYLVKFENGEQEWLAESDLIPA